MRQSAKRHRWGHPAGLVALGMTLAGITAWKGADATMWLMVAGIYLGVVLIWIFVMPHVDGVFWPSRDQSK